VLILSFDTATDLATSALVADGAVLCERTTRPQSLLADVDALLVAAEAAPSDISALVVGTGPGSFMGTRVGLAVARGLALSLDIPMAGVSTLSALATAAEAAYPVIDARRGEVFVEGPRALRPEDVAVTPGILCIGNGACLYRDVLEARGAVVPPDDATVHVPRASLHAAVAAAGNASFGPADAVQPVYVRNPDAALWTR
jgi:tRNA threonylcarbamoyladenosine biosynthesis protein TsaB